MAKKQVGLEKITAGKHWSNLKGRADAGRKKFPDDSEERQTARGDAALKSAALCNSDDKKTTLNSKTDERQRNNSMKSGSPTSERNPLYVMGVKRMRQLQETALSKEDERKTEESALLRRALRQSRCFGERKVI